MRIFVPIITVLLLTGHAAACSDVLDWAGTLGNAVHSLLSAEERVSHNFLILFLSFNINYDGITV